MHPETLLKMIDYAETDWDLIAAIREAVQYLLDKEIEREADASETS